MIRQLFTILALSASVLTGCTIGPPVTDVRQVPVGPMERVLRAAVVAATASDWVPKTISAESGYVMAERSELRQDPYRLELMIPPGGTGSMSVKVTPLSRTTNGTQDGASSLMKRFLEAFDQALSANR